METWIQEMLKSSFLEFDGSVNWTISALTQSLDSWDMMIANVANVIKPFCLVIIGLILLLELAQTAAKVDMLKWEHGLKLMIKIVLAKVCIDYAPQFLQACYQQAVSWINLVNVGTLKLAVGNDILDTVGPLVKQISGIFESIGLFLSIGIVLIVIKICGLIVQVIAFGRMFEIYVYVAISPFPCAFLPLGTGEGVGISRITSKFFKAFIAVCLQGLIILVVFNIYNATISTTIKNMASEYSAEYKNPVDEDGKIDEEKEEANKKTAEQKIIGLVYIMLLGSIALVMAVIKSGSWAKSLIDAT